MPKEAVLFPGQGLSPQEIIGFFNKLDNLNSDIVRRQLSLAQDVINQVHGSLEFSLLSSLADEKSPSFERTAFVQPLVYSLSVISYEITHQNPDFVAGHSLGEYAAITVAEVVEGEEGINLVVHRGKFMQEACDQTPSRLVSVQGLTLEAIQNILQQDDTRFAEVALINTPDIIVVGCAAELVPEVEQLTKSAGASKTTRLNTAGAFHTSFMADVVAKLELVMPQFKQPKIPLVPNLTGELVEDGQFSKDLLLKALTNPVQWAKGLYTLRTSGVQNFYEAGPGRSLKSLNRLNGFSRDQTRNVVNGV